MRGELVLALLAAGSGGELRKDTPPPPVGTAPADSLALTLGSGAEVWFTRGREAEDSSGAPCLERTLEIRRDTTRKAVPLLYAREAPVAVDDTLFRAILSRDCAPVGTYRVSVSDAQPHRETP